MVTVLSIDEEDVTPTVKKNTIILELESYSIQIKWIGLPLIIATSKTE